MDLHVPCCSGGTVSCTLPFTTNVTISTSISQRFSFLISNSQSSPAYFISYLIRYGSARSPYDCFILSAVRLYIAFTCLPSSRDSLHPKNAISFRHSSPKRNKTAYRTGICQGTFQIISYKVIRSLWGSHQTI